MISERGEILDVSFNSEDLARDLEARPPWLHRPWIDTVSLDSRPKVEMLLREAAIAAPSRVRHVNHPSRNGRSVPILYSAVRVGDDGRMVAFGRDLRPVAELQQRLVDAQQSMEQDYNRLRDAESRYRLLFQMTSEAVLILDSASLRVTEANQAAQLLFGEAEGQLHGQFLPQAFDADGAQRVQSMLATVRAAGRADDVQVRRDGGEAEFNVSASLFREGNLSRFLVRVLPASNDAARAASAHAAAPLLDLVEHAPDGFVVITEQGDIVAANTAFWSFAQVARPAQAHGENLDRWFGREGVDLTILLANVRQRGTVRLFATIMRGEHGAVTPVEVSAVALNNGGHPCCGLALRDVSRRITVVPDDNTPHSTAQLTELIGRVPLKELVRQSTEVIERLCIETALQMTGDNRAGAAEMLGLSRQSFYVKLRRYGLGDLTQEDDET